jgi:hypothetical protein
VQGDNLSPRAQAWVNGQLLPADRVAPAEPTNAEFVTELVLTPEQIVELPPKVAAVKITNPDGQSAEAGQTART